MNDLLCYHCGKVFDSKSITIEKIIFCYTGCKPVYKLLSGVKNRLRKELKKKINDTFFTIGFLNGFLPCGLVYMAIFASIATGNAISGSLYMMLFG